MHESEHGNCNSEEESDRKGERPRERDQDNIKERELAKKIVRMGK